mmetsp:Transcript_10203/g.16746  ORF Transcript_10203/g.16746 Transcript_10203/m.16746 type:complete len:359 (-) Transcript_10203:120-1196(-)
MVLSTYLKIVFLTAFVFTVRTFTLNPEFQGWVGCISHHEIKPMLAHKTSAKKSTVELECSIDLGMSKKLIYLDEMGISLKKDSKDHLATWKELEKIAKKQSGCYALYDDNSSPWKISTISETTNNPASLVPPLEASGAPTMVLGGFTMHRIAGDDVNPTIDTKHKLSSIQIKNPRARILDTCMGLGYTATAAARKIQACIREEENKEGMSPQVFATSTSTTNEFEMGYVTTIEYDEASVEMCAFNPWSQQLFDKSLPIEILQGDACELVKTFKDGEFDRVIHDPPARALCTKDLYGLQFYSDLYRVLRKPGGTLFHYIGNPKSKESGRLYKGIKQRLSEAGFSDIRTAESAFGIVART